MAYGIRITISPTIFQGQAVVATYTDPTAGDDANAIQDTAGNDAATFTTGMDGVPAVTNNSAVTNTPATGAPAITGTAQVGQTLTAGTTAIMDDDGLTSVSYTYQWIRVATDNTETNISGATASTHTLVAADLGTTIKVKVSFTDDASNPETLTSAATTAVSPAPNPNAHCNALDTSELWCGILTVGVSNVVVFGYNRSLFLGSVAPLTFTHGGATITVNRLVYLGTNFRFGMSSALGAGDFSLEIGTGGAKRSFAMNNPGIEANFINHGLSWSANETVPFKLLLVNTPATGAPAITGTAQVGQTLTATVGDIADVDGLPDPFLTDANTSFQWIRVATDNSETDISGAMAGAYMLVADDQGTTIKVKVSFTGNNGFAETRTSAATAAVAAAPDTTPPTLTSADVEITDALIINLVFSEDLQLSNRPAVSAFTVTVDGSAATVSSVLVPGSILPQNKLWLQLSTAILQGQAVVVTYTDPTAGNDHSAIQDIAGNDAADLHHRHERRPRRHQQLPHHQHPRDGRADDYRHGAGRGDADGGHHHHHGCQRAEQRQLHVPVDPGGRRHRDEHLRGDGEHPHAGGGGPGHDDQGKGELHRRRQQRRDADQRGDGGRHCGGQQPADGGDRDSGPVGDRAGTAFSYAFPANTFSDADTGDTLTYTATKADDTALPTVAGLRRRHAHLLGHANGRGDGGREGDRQRRQRRVGQRYLRHHGCGGHHPAHADQRHGFRGPVIFIQLQFSENMLQPNLPPMQPNLPPNTTFTVTAAGSAVTVSSVQPAFFPPERVLDPGWAYHPPGPGRRRHLHRPHRRQRRTPPSRTLPATTTPTFTTGMDGVPAVTNNSTFTNTPATGAPTITGTATGRADADGGHHRHHGYQRADRRQLHLPVDPGGHRQH